MLSYIQTRVITRCVIKHLVKMVIKGLHLYTDSTKPEICIAEKRIYTFSTFIFHHGQMIVLFAIFSDINRYFLKLIKYFKNTNKR